MSLETTIKEIQSLKPFAEENTDTGPVETLNGRRGRKAQAIERIKILRRSYTNELLRSAIFIIVAGKGRDDFEKVATGEKFNLFSADPEAFYKDLAGRVHPTLYQGKASPSNLFDVLGRHLEDKMNELEVNEYNQVVFREKYIQEIASPEEFAQLVKVAVNEQIGSEIVGIQAASSITDKAIEIGHSAKLTPIVLNTGDHVLALRLLEDLQRLTTRVFLVNVGSAPKNLKGVQEAINVKDASEDNVKSTFDTILQSIKK